MSPDPEGPFSCSLGSALYHSMSVSDVCFECMSGLLSYHLNLSLACALGLSDQTPPGLEDTDACSLPLVCGESLPVLSRIWHLWTTSSSHEHAALECPPTYSSPFALWANERAHILQAASFYFKWIMVHCNHPSEISL